MVNRMGKVLSLGLVLVITAICIGCGNEGSINRTATGESAITFPDANLEAAIRETIGKPEGPIYTSDLEEVTFLAAARKDITDLTGLEYCPNLTHLSPAYNRVSDISVLASLTSLTWLDLAYNLVSDISPLASLTNLTVLHLPYNAISDISPLASLTNLTWPHLAMNMVSDVSSLASLTNLTWLSLAQNQTVELGDISPLASLINLTHLGLDVNQISDISPLASLTNLTWLNLGDNRIDDISSLRTLPNLEQLYLQKNGIGDLSSLTGLASLRELQLYDNDISDISPLVENIGLSAGATINLTNNPLGTMSVNACIPQLEGKGVEVAYFKLRISVPYDTFIESQNFSRQAELAVGDVFTVALYSDPTTAGRWPESAQIDVQSVIEQVAYRLVSPEGDVTAAMAEEVWTFRALKEGTAEVLLQYSQPWDGDEKIEWTFRLTAVVK